MKGKILWQMLAWHCSAHRQASLGRETMYFIEAPSSRCTPRYVFATQCVGPESPWVKGFAVSGIIYSQGRNP
eukprot:754045-Hanusia_phi.AAC.8